MRWGPQLARQGLDCIVIVILLLFLFLFIIMIIISFFFFFFLSQLTPEVLHSLTKIARGASEVLEIQKMGKFAQVPPL